jgi:hypothetical protein
VVHGLKLLSCGVQPSQSGVRNIKASQFSHMCCVPSHNHPTQARLNTPIVRPGQQVPPCPTRRAPAHPGVSSQSRRALIPASLHLCCENPACMHDRPHAARLPLPLHTHISCNPQLANSYTNPFPNPFPPLVVRPEEPSHTDAAGVPASSPASLKRSRCVTPLSASQPCPILQRAPPCQSRCGFSPLQSCTRETPAA